MLRQTPARTTVLAALCVALLAVILVEIRSRPQLVVQPPEFELPVAADADPQPETPPSEATEIPIEVAIERPLFSPARSQTPVAAPPDPAPTSSGFSLIGVTISPDERVAVLVPPGGGAPERLRVGESYDGWSAVSIEADHVVFRQGDVEEKIYLNFNLPAPAVAQPSADGTVPAGQDKNSWSGGEPPDREAETVGGGDGNANP